MPNWTLEQQNAIQKTGNNIIVSAGAGSGKTAVLTARVIENIKRNININELLILTFTKAAAMEMKERIGKALKKEGRSDQLALLNSSYITTFDSFALSLVKRYHYVLNVSKEIEICPESLINVITIKVIDEVFSSLFKEKYESFLKLIDKFALKSDNDLKKVIYIFNSKFDQYIDKEKALKEYIENHFSAPNINYLEERFEQLLISKIDCVYEKICELSSETSGKTLEAFKNHIISLENAETVSEKMKILEWEFPRKNSDCSDEYSNLKTPLNDEIKALTNLFANYDKESMAKELASEKEILAPIVEILIKVEDRLKEVKKEKEIYTFYDIAKKAIFLVKNNKAIREELQNEFKEIMIDEYQDTSDIQEELIQLISRKNVYMVGDIKQSIYGFRNANPSLFKDKYSTFSKVGTEDENSLGIRIDLTKNFRSRMEVVKLINNMFDKVMDQDFGGVDFSDGHQMVQGNLTYDASPKEIDYSAEILDYSTLIDENFSKQEKEAFTVATDILLKVGKMEVLDKNTNVYRKCKYSDFTILCDRKTSYATFKQVFEYFNIPLTIIADEAINKRYTLKTFKNVLNFIINIYNKNFSSSFYYNFTSIARSYLFRLSDEEIFSKVTKKNVFDTEIYKISSEIARSIDTSTTMILLEKIINDFGFLDKAKKIGFIDNLEAEVEYLKSLGESSDNIFDFAEFLETVTAYDVDLKYNLMIDELSAVKMMNIHKSKGLEFSICYYVGLSSKFNDSDIKAKFIFDKEIGMVAPIIENGERECFLKEICKYNYKVNDISEKIRLFYVALTRAKEKIIFVDDLEKFTSIPLTKSSKLKINNFKTIVNSVFSFLNVKEIKASDINVLLDSSYLISKKENINTLLEKEEYQKVKPLDVQKIETIESSKIENKMKYSKQSYEIEDYLVKQKKKLGTKMHELLEVIDITKIEEALKLPLDKDERKILEKMQEEELFRKKYLHVYKEHEFMYNGNVGIIDLLLEDEDSFAIVDYKLKNIDDNEYEKQINGYKEYVKSITKKNVKTYLYSLFDGILKEIK